MKRLHGNLTFANVVALTALFVALGGSAYAATQLPKNSVGSKQIKKAAVTPAKLSAAAKSTLTGAAGAAGPQGPKGDTGATGLQGSTGDQGDRGETGPSTGPAGGALTGTYPNPILAPGSVGTSNFASGAVAPGAADAARLGGVLPSGYQKRVTGTCGAGEAVRTVAEDGTVTCQPIAQSLGYTASPTVSGSEVALATIDGYTLDGRCTSASTTVTVTLAESTANTFTLTGWFQEADDITNGGSATPTFSDYSFAQHTGSGTLFGTTINNAHSRHVWANFFLTNSDGSVIAITTRMFVDSGLSGHTPTCQISGIAAMGA
jgi:hypothetical protein